MRSVAAAIILGFAAAAQAAVALSPCLSLVNDIPECGLSCIIAGGGKYGCSVLDVACQCKNFGAIAGDETSCVISACGASGIAAVLNPAEALCSCVSTAKGTLTASDASCTALVNDIPSCGLPCIISAGNGVGCKPLDIQCQCKQYNKLVGVAAGCVAKACGASVPAVLAAAGSLCGCATGGAAVATSSAPASSAAGATTTAANSVASSAAAAGSSAASSAAGAASSASVAASSSVEAAASTAAVASSVSTGAAVQTGAANVVAGSLFGAVGAFAAVVAAL